MSKKKPVKKKKPANNKTKDNPLGLSPPKRSENPHDLSVRWFYFVEYMIQTKGNKTESARRAGFGGKNPTDNTLAVTGNRLVRNDKIRSALADRHKDMVMDSNKALWNLSRLADIVDVADYISFRDVYAVSKGEDKTPYLTGVIADFDINRFQADGFGHLIKSIRNTSSGPSIELRDPESANVWIGKSQGAFMDVIKDERERTIKVVLKDE